MRYDKLFRKAYRQGRKDRKAGLAMQAHDWIPNGKAWDNYVTGYAEAGQKRRKS